MKNKPSELQNKSSDMQRKSKWQKGWIDDRAIIGSRESKTQTFEHILNYYKCTLEAMLHQDNRTEIWKFL